MTAFLVTLGFGALMGLIIGIFSIVFEVKEDPLVAQITELLPGYNCGGCGYPGCNGFAEALVSKEVSDVAGCRPSNEEQRNSIAELLNN